MLHITRRSLLYGLTTFVVLICLSLSISLASSPKASAQANATVTHTFSGTVTSWSDNSLFAGPASQTITSTVSYDSTTGAVTAFSFPPFQLTDPATGNTITVSLPSGATPTGTFDATTGAFTVTTPLELQNVPLFGTVTTSPITLSTENSISPPDGNTYAGSREDASGNITVVGQTSFTDIITVNIWIRIVGVVS